MPGPPPLRPGDPDRLGSYRLVGFLGEGGQGAVYLGEAPDGRKVAVKVLHARFAADDKALKRFLREVESARKVAQFCTARVLDVATSGDRPYIVSEYVQAESLKELVDREGPRDLGFLERLAVDAPPILAAVQRQHRQPAPRLRQVLHRDHPARSQRPYLRQRSRTGSHMA
jgi:serine/threonine protein kinase